MNIVLLIILTVFLTWAITIAAIAIVGSAILLIFDLVTNKINKSTIDKR